MVESDTRPIVTKRAIIPLNIILANIDNRLAADWDSDSLDDDAVKKKQRISTALQQALQLWSAEGWRLVQFLPGMKTISEVKRKFEELTNRNDAVRNLNLVDENLVWKLFTALVPYMCESGSDDIVIDTITWSDTVANDPVLDVSFFRVY